MKRYLSILKFLAIAMLVVLVSGEAFAFGSQGHRIVADVADHLLNAKARVRINHITGGESLADLSTFMDEERRSLGKTIAEWHYQNLPVCSVARPDIGCYRGNCVSAQIMHMYELLERPDLSPDGRKETLAFLVHLVGDIHQPLHAADNHDRGGNDIRVQLPYGRHERSLHQAWDSDFIKEDLRGWREKDYAASLSGSRPEPSTKLDTNMVSAWLMESHTLAQKVAYGEAGGFSCSANQEYLTVDQAYDEHARAILRAQLSKAGHRLAGILNGLFGE